MLENIVKLWESKILITAVDLEYLINLVEFSFRSSQAFLFCPCVGAQAPPAIPRASHPECGCCCSSCAGRTCIRSWSMDVLGIETTKRFKFKWSFYSKIVKRFMEKTSSTNEKLTPGNASEKWWFFHNFMYFCSWSGQVCCRWQAGNRACYCSNVNLCKLPRLELKQAFLKARGQSFCALRQRITQPGTCFANCFFPTESAVKSPVLFLFVLQVKRSQTAWSRTGLTIGIFHV